jgi:hypothetical protein
MPNTRFNVGDQVRLARRARLQLASNGTYEVVKVLAGDETEVSYRVKAWDEPFPRTIPEHELSFDERPLDDRVPLPPGAWLEIRA